MPPERPLKELSTQQLRQSTEQAFERLGDALAEAVERTGGPGTRLFRELKDRRPRPGRLDPPDAEREHSVYVIQLDSAVLQQTAFKNANPGHVEGCPCVYVGMTSHSPRHRLRQHMAGDKAGRFVQDFGRGLLPDLYENRNPLTRREAVIEERALAMELREAGYAVWQK